MDEEKLIDPVGGEEGEEETTSAPETTVE